MIDSPENVKALQFMVDGVKDGAAARGVTTYMEEESRRYFESGKATFMRNWPYAYALGEKAPAVKGKFDVMPFPEFEGGGKAGILGGHNQVISVVLEEPGRRAEVDRLRHRQGASEGRRCSTTRSPRRWRRRTTTRTSRRSTSSPTELKDAISQAKARPVSPVYPQISQAIYQNVNEALAGRTSPEDALKKAQSEMQSALETF